jgi:hypothetical protein
VRKTYLRDEQMSDAAFVEQASAWARDLTNRESRGPGDIENAWRRLEARYGIPTSVFWSLRYRKPKGVFVGVYSRLHAAYLAECERQKRLLEHDIEVTKKIAGPAHAAVVAAEAVVRAAEKEEMKCS